MRYLEFSLAVRPNAVETAADLLRAFVPSGVSIEPRFVDEAEGGAVEIDDTAPVLLRAWLPQNARKPAEIARFRRDARALQGVTRALRVRTVDGDAWATSWRKHFVPIRIGRRLVIRPPWRAYRARKDDVVLQLDPGMAFGTGQHETTRMCLEAIEERLPARATVLDLGCGSGILAIAAALLGAKRVDALDIDPAAVAATKENGAANGVGRAVKAVRGSLGRAWPLRAKAPGRYDLVAANLNSGLIIEHARHVVDAVRDDGVALLSGLVAQNEDACVGALTTSGGSVVETKRAGDWRLLVVSRA